VLSSALTWCALASERLVGITLAVREQFNLSLSKTWNYRGHFVLGLQPIPTASLMPVTLGEGRSVSDAAKDRHTMRVGADFFWGNIDLNRTIFRQVLRRKPDEAAPRKKHSHFPRGKIPSFGAQLCDSDFSAVHLSGGRQVLYGRYINEGIYVDSRSCAGIFVGKSKYDHRLPINRVVETDNGDVGIEPWSALRDHLIQLPLHNSRLSLHRHQLKIEDDSTYSGDRRQNDREYPYTARPARHHSFIYLVLGFTAIFASFGAMIMAFKGAEYADDRGLPWWPPLFAFLGLALIFAYQGISLLTSAYRLTEDVPRISAVLVAKLGSQASDASHSSSTRTISANSQSLPVTPAAIAGVTLSVWWMRTKIVVHEMDGNGMRVVLELL
jgi:hypothetical protein